MLKDRLSITGGWQFHKWLFGPEMFSGLSRNGPGPGCSKADKLNPRLAYTFVPCFQLFGESFFFLFLFSRLTSFNVKFCRTSAMNSILE